MFTGNREEKGRPVKIKDEGLTLVSNVASIDLVGDGVSSSAIGDDVTHNIPGSGSTDWLLNGNTLGSKKTLGSIDNYDIGFITNNTERLTVLNSGNVGIGTTNPSRLLNVNGTALIGSDTAQFSEDFKLQVKGTTHGLAVTTNLPTTSTNGLALSVGVVGERFVRTNFYSNSQIGFGPGNATRDVFIGRTSANTIGITGDYDGSGSGNFYVSGNVGIGTTSPSEKLNVSGNILATGYVTGKKVGVFAYLDAADDTTITTAGTYYPIEGTFNNSPIEGFSAGTVYTPSIKYTESLTQYFEIDWHATVEVDQVNTDVSIGIKKNGTLVTSSVMKTRCFSSAAPYALSGTCVVELAQNDEIQLVVTSDGSGDVITFDNFTTTINEFFD